MLYAWILHLLQKLDLKGMYSGCDATMHVFCSWCIYTAIQNKNNDYKGLKMDLSVLCCSPPLLTVRLFCSCEVGGGERSITGQKLNRPL